MARALDNEDVVYKTFVRIGPYEADIVIPAQILWSRKVGPIVIECDGAFWHRGREDKDARKDRYLKACGYTVFRLSEADIKQSAAACARKVLG